MAIISAEKTQNRVMLGKLLIQELLTAVPRLSHHPSPALHSSSPPGAVTDLLWSAFKDAGTQLAQPQISPFAMSGNSVFRFSNFQITPQKKVFSPNIAEMSQVRNSPLEYDGIPGQNYRSQQFTRLRELQNDFGWKKP